MKTTYQKFISFLKDQGASVLVYAALAIIPIIGFAGVAIDTARGYMLRSHLSSSLDAAALAAGRSVTEEEIQLDVSRYFFLNYRTGYMNATLEGPFATPNNQTNEIIVHARATIKTAFMHLFGQPTLSVSAQTKIQRNVRGMELVLVMDNTGSMRSGNKMNTMKSSAKELIDILYGEEETIENFAVGLVPYTATVNIGNQYFDWLTGYDPSAYNPTIWKGCVDARNHPYDTLDDVPTVEPFKAYLYPDDVDNDWPPIREENSWENDGLGPNLGCGPAITPLISAHSAIDQSIDEMLPWHRGGTLTNMGLVWGWRAISPKWRGLWDGVDPALPVDYNTPLIDKVVIILTDGVNQFFDFEGGGPQGSDHTAYGRRDSGILGVTGSAVTQEINHRMAKTCESMKQEGIIIYTITFQLGSGGATPDCDIAASACNITPQNLFKRCATSENHFFNSPTNNELSAVFRKIGNELSNLRITQ